MLVRLDGVERDVTDAVPTETVDLSLAEEGYIGLANSDPGEPLLDAYWVHRCKNPDVFHVRVSGESSLHTRDGKMVDSDGNRVGRGHYNMRDIVEFYPRLIRATSGSAC